MHPQWSVGDVGDARTDAAACRAAGGGCTGDQWREQVGPEFADADLCG